MEPPFSSAWDSLVMPHNLTISCCNNVEILNLMSLIKVQPCQQLSLLPPQYHMKRKKVYNLFVFKSGQQEISSWLGNINSFMSVLRESLRFGGRKRLFRCSQPFSHHPPACFLSCPLPGNVTVSPPTTLVAAPQKCPISCGSPGFLCLCISRESKALSLWSWQVCLAFTAPKLLSRPSASPVQSPGTISSPLAFMIQL